MKLNDLAIFVEVAKAPSLRSAANQLDMQPGTLSKIIKRIEAYYQQELFNRHSANWTLTSSGEMLFQRAIELVAINDKIERELGKPRRPHMRVSGSEAILGYFLPTLLQRLSAKQIHISLETKDAQDLALLRKHDVDLALVSSLSTQNPSDRQIVADAISTVNFVTVVDSSHPLAARGQKSVFIEEVLEYPFVVPSKAIYGSVDTSRSHDGWHDDDFSRHIMARVDTASMLIAMVKTQGMLAYLPDYIAREHNLKVISIEGCPYSCEQTIWMCRHKQLHHHWMQAFV